MRRKMRPRIAAAARRYRRAGGRFDYVRRAALRKGKTWKLTKSEYEALLDAPCDYCGWPNDVETGVGLDRLDNERGYEVGNVVSCCALCNLVRGDRFSPTEMKRLGRVVDLIKKDRDGVTIVQRAEPHDAMTTPVYDDLQPVDAGGFAFGP